MKNRPTAKGSGCVRCRHRGAWPERGPGSLGFAPPVGRAVHLNTSRALLSLFAFSFVAISPPILTDFISFPFFNIQNTNTVLKVKAPPKSDLREACWWEPALLLRAPPSWVAFCKDSRCVVLSLLRFVHRGSRLVHVRPRTLLFSRRQHSLAVPGIHGAPLTPFSSCTCSTVGCSLVPWVLRWFPASCSCA